MQLQDYLGTPITIIYDMSVPKVYQFVRKYFSHWLQVNLHKKKDTLQSDFKFKRIETFIPKKSLPKLPREPYLRRFRGIPQVIFEDYAFSIISEKEWMMLHTLQSFDGYFNHLFEFNDFSYFDDLQVELELQGTNFKDLFLHDIIIMELLRRQLGFHDFTGLEKMAYFLHDHPLRALVHDPTYFPTAADVSYVLTRIPSEKILQFFNNLVKEGIELGIIDPRILLWDGQFVRTNSSNNFKDEEAKKKKQYSDPDAGYGRHLGVKKGVGYEISNLYAFSGNWNRTLPVYFKVYPANDNENPVFRDTVNLFLKSPIGIGWIMIILDSGGYSQKSLDFCKNNAVYPLIRAKKNLKNHPTREFKKGYYFNTEYVPEGWSDGDLVSAYALRPAIEAGQSANNTFYNSRRLNTRGKEMATISRGLNYILDWMRAITAFKLGRIDLIGKLSAFSSTREHMGENAWIKFAHTSGFVPLQGITLNERQKAFWDKRRKWEAELKEKRKNIKS